MVSYLDIPGCITCGETIETAVVNTMDAKKAWIEVALVEGIEINDPNNLNLEYLVVCIDYWRNIQKRKVSV